MRPLLLALLAVLPSFAWSATASDFLFRTYVSPDTAIHDLPYRLLVPAGYNASTKYPLIIFLHGQGERGTDNTAQMNNNANGALALVSTANQAAYPCFMICPQGHIDYGWNATNEAQIVAVIDQLLATYNIDRDRVYITGLSMGGAGTWDIIQRYPYRFAAAVPQSGWGAGNYARLAALPIWAFHAANDGTVGVGGTDNAVSGVRSAGGRVVYTRYDTGGHGIWPVAYATPALLPWMMAQRRNHTVAGTPILTITTPASDLVADAAATMNLAGSSAFPSGSAITNVQWTTNLTNFTTASGTTTWSANSLAVANGTTLYSALATGPSWSASYGGVTTVSDCVRVVRGSTDVTAPTISITAPTGAGLTVSGTLVTISGTTADSGGINQVSWSNNRGGQGVAIGTTAWSINDITLLSGANVITITVRDNANRTTTTTITITSTTGSTDVTPPTISVTAPTGAGLTVSGTAVNVSGTAADSSGINQVTWSNNRGGSGTASGTTAWSIAGIALLNGANVITVTARDGANLTTATSITVTSTAGSTDVTPPTISVTTPTGAGLTVSGTSVNVSGTAADSSGINQVTWSNNRGGSGTATGTTAWSITGIALLNGA
ncbi:MAG TPA: Ig-like domain-containing protein, partial [Planctomycetota bacterium]|nr:Ig-like domain-containing protein [Planctomycetota bacterium]